METEDDVPVMRSQDRPVPRVNNTVEESSIAQRRQALDDLRSESDEDAKAKRVTSNSRNDNATALSQGSQGSNKKSPAKYMSFEGSAAAAMERRKTLRASQQSDNVRYALAKEAASPLKRQSS